MTAHDDTVNRLVVLLISNVTPAVIEEKADDFGLTPKQLKVAISEARRRITLAADFHRDTEIGTAYVRLNELFRRSLEIQDAKTALAAQRELNKLLRLYDGPTTADGIGAPERAGGVDASELQAIREHLEPLALGPADYPLRELARIAAERLRTVAPQIAKEDT